MKASLNTLALYSEARTALTLLKKTDEILDVRDKMRALEFYGEQIHDTSLASAAAEVKIRAERRFGQVVRALEKAGKLPMGGRPKKRAAKQRDKNPSPTAGVSRRQKANSRKLADMPEDKFEGALARQKDGKRKPTVNRDPRRQGDPPDQQGDQGQLGCAACRCRAGIRTAEIGRCRA